jgi:hypothetical protein
MPTLSRVKAGEKFLKRVPKDSFRNLNIFSLKSKGGPKEPKALALFEGKGVKLETRHPSLTDTVELSYSSAKLKLN